MFILLIDYGIHVDLRQRNSQNGKKQPLDERPLESRRARVLGRERTARSEQAKIRTGAKVRGGRCIAYTGPERTDRVGSGPGRRREERRQLYAVIKLFEQ